MEPIVKLYLLRHARANPPGWQGPDDERPLDAQGRRDARRIGEFLRRAGVAPTVLATSPLARAVETAQIAGESLAVEPVIEPLLAPEFDAAKLAVVRERHPAVELLLVGHEPDLTRVVRALTGGATRLAKGAVARVDLEGPGPEGELVWLVAPELVRD
jgi:phosphohistidine phosphatase